MSRESGAKRIFLYNWPLYVSTWVLSWVVAAALGPLGWLAAVVAVGWSAISLGTSFYIYDRSELLGGKWLVALLPHVSERWAAVDAGLDAEIDLKAAMPGRCVGRLDIFQPEFMRAGSIRRARQRTARVSEATPSSPVALALPDASCDAVVVAFVAHELNAADTREKFFLEVSRVLRRGGRMVLVEHVRDAANFAVFGPGFWHFLPRSEWLRLAQHSKLKVVIERRVTPWVVAWALEKPS